MDIQAGPIGSIGSESVKFEGGNLVVAAEAKAGEFVQVGASVKVSAKPVAALLLGKLKELIPGKFDDLIIDEGLSALNAWIDSQK